jgi:acetyl-CoA carboxylase biotin carboxyl carrier protein
MKIMNEVEAEFDCKILDILVQNGEPVEYDMPIFIVEKV